MTKQSSNSAILIFDEFKSYNPIVFKRMKKSLKLSDQKRTLQEIIDKFFPDEQIALYGKVASLSDIKSEIIFKLIKRDIPLTAKNFEKLKECLSITFF